MSTGRVCLVSHDAGGAEILASYVAQEGIECRFVLDGPALDVFHRHFGDVKHFAMEEALASCDWCLLGTSWQSDLEWQALALARRAGKRAISFIDHWVNYAERFERHGERRLPDEIWTGDDEAYALATHHFPGVPVKVVPNPYLGYMKREIARREAPVPGPRQAAARLLFVCENLSGIGKLRFGDERYLGYNEFDALEYFFSRLPDLDLRVDRVRLRPHPSDPAGKYARLIEAHAPVAQLSEGRLLADEIAESDVVAGCESMAMVVALAAGRRVLCVVPPRGKVSFIDRRPGVEMLRDRPKRSAAAA